MAIAVAPLLSAPPIPADAERGPALGYTGMWVGICLEFFEFSVLFAVYFGARVLDPSAFRDGAGRLSALAGMAITLVMVSAGFFMSRTVDALRANQQRAARWWILAALLCACLYPVIKYLEIQSNNAHHLSAAGNVFVTVYYYLTLNHLIHASWGIMGMTWLTTCVWMNRFNQRSVEALAIYWHATDIVWLMIFSFFYAFV